MNKSQYLEKVREYKLLAKKEVGQNFLVDEGVASKTILALDIQPEDRILEIGPGAGSLSVFLADYQNEADLVDIDEALIAKLTEDFEGFSNIHPIKSNALKIDLSPYTKVVGNLPYYITSSLIERVLLDAEHCRRAVFMVQKEAFARLTAPVGSEDYGPLPILLRYLGSAKKELSVSRLSFVPAPHVDSIVFSLSFRPDADRTEAKKLYALAEKLFLHRRKTILNNLVSYLGDGVRAKEILKQASIPETTRPEALSVDCFLSLLHLIEQ